VLIVTLITRTDLLKKDNTDTNYTYSDYDVYGMLENILNIKNIYVEIVLSNDTKIDFYLKDNMKKLSDGKLVSIYNLASNRFIEYKVNEFSGMDFPSLSKISSDYSDVCEEIINKKEFFDYTINTDIIDYQQCVKVTFTYKESNNFFCVLWFDINNNLIVKKQGSENKDNYILYKNIKLDCVTDKDFNIPSNIVITKIDIN
jgi:hypothetical protein